MKLSKKLLAILMVFTMVFGLSATAFASTKINDSSSVYNGTYPVTIRIDNNGDETIDQTQVVYLKDNGNYVDNAGVTHSKYTNSGTHTIENYDKATAFDALYATGLLSDISEVQYVDSNWNPINKYGLAFDTFNSLSSDEEDIVGGTRYYYWSFDVTYDDNTVESPANNYSTHYGVAEDTRWEGETTQAGPISSITMTYTSYDYIYN